jgi:biopolymer transport protein ExbD
MAIIKKKSHRDMPGIATSSDIMFILLFFFMATTTSREVEYKVKINLPSVSEAKKVEDKSLVSYIYVGPPTKVWESKYGSKPVVQLNDQISSIAYIPQYIEEERSKRAEEDVPKMTFSLKIDENTDMGIVTDIKQILRKAQALKINYSAKKSATKSN